ncbi:MAG TPA: hypothetical protein VE974_10520 [Thermoanaerobaculia bacterium]|nr:hypothetical protein [Thermoanaerobaculia bacterium]
MTPKPQTERRRKAPFPRATASARLQRIVRATLGSAGAARGTELLARLLARRTHDPAFAAELMEIARGSRGDAWPVRRLACLALEHELLRIAGPDDLLALLSGLGLLTDTCEYVRRFVLQEGYSTVTVLQFAGELRQRIARHEHVHAALARAPLRGAADFLAHSLHECHLALARYLLSPEEVVREIVEQVRTTAGLPYLPKTDPYNIGEAKRAIESLPPYERRILQLLMDEPVIYWVADQTPSTLHSLVEYPIGTVVLIVKPPGSDLEIEIKRAGCRGERALDCVYKHPGSNNPVPVHHHFWGGTTGRLVRWELSSAATLARLHRLAYGVESPGSRLVALSGVLDVPTPRGDVSLVSYFGSPEGYGPGYGGMRAAMKEALPRLERDPIHAAGGDPGGYGTLGRWLAVTSPEQAFVLGTSSFRMDRIAAYLAADGDDVYFTQGLGVTADNAGRRRLADAVAGEIVPHYTPPAVPFRSYRQYVDALYAANREQLDATYLDVMAQVGHYFGFYSALRMWSEGESFVTRNVGLRNIFTGGDWKVRVLFADHDSVSLPGRDYDLWDPGATFHGLRHDMVHVLGGRAGVRTVPGEAATIRAIYRVTPAVAEAGLRAFRMSCRDSYFHAHDAVETNDPLRRMFTRGFVKELRDWDDLVRGWTDAREQDAVDHWRDEAVAMLRERGYSKGRAAGLVEGLLRNAADVERYTFLYRPELVG